MIGAQGLQAGQGSSNRVSFAGLNALRLLAAFSVLIQHTEHIPTVFGRENRILLGYVCLSGKDAVNLFFVLSGFLPAALAALIIGKLSLHYLLTGSVIPKPVDSISVFCSFSLEYMALGGIGAYLVHAHRQRVLRVLYHPVTQVGAALLCLGAVLPCAPGPRLPAPFAACLFLVILLNVACNPRPLLSLENQLFDFGGKLSSGIYMFPPSSCSSPVG